GIGVPDYAMESLKDLVDILSHYLLRAHGAGKRVVLVVDEAQNLAPEVLEQVRLLTNLETNTQKLLQIILIGQPELRELLARNELRQLAQRITGRYHLCPLLGPETTAYVRHRLRVAGATNDIFTPHALAEVHRLSGGVPRVINIICDRALLGAYTQDRHRVTASMVRRSAQEVFGRRLLPWWAPWGAMAASAAVIILGAVALWRFVPWTAERHASPVAAASHRGSVTREPASPAGTATAAPGGGAVPAAGAAAAAASSPAVLAQLLAAHGSETDTDSAFAKLFALWGARYVAGNVDPCTQ